MINNYENVNLDDRVFNVGLGRTGTSSLADALNILGYKVWHGNFYRKLREEYFTRFNALTDTHLTGPSRPDLDFRRVHQEYPDTKFILTVRNDTDKWFDSVMKTYKKHTYVPGWKGIWYGRMLGENYKDVYPGEPTKEDFIREYHRYNAEVMDYFNENDPDALLVFNVIDGDDGWEELCQFLGKEIPDSKYPRTDEIEITFKLSLYKFLGL